MLAPALLLLALGGEKATAQSCSVGGTTGSYGTVDILAGGAVSTSANFSVSCTGTANSVVRLCVELSPGQTNSSGNRRLAAGTGRLVHELYADAAHTTIWGSWGLATTAYALYPNGVSYDLNLGGSGSASANLTVYGSVFASQPTAPPGSYVWTTSNSPAAEYAYKTSTACPTGNIQAVSAGSSWTATISANCTVSTSPMSYGTIGSIIAANVDTSTTITAKCTNTTPYSIGLDNGQHATGSQRRMMLAAGQYVSYGLYLDNAYSQPWQGTTSTTSCTSGNSTCYLGTGTGSDQAVSIYGQVPPQSAPAVGTYTDTVVVTVTF